MYDWSGSVPANAEQGQPTGLILLKGDIISIIAKGWVKFGSANNEWSAPQGDTRSIPKISYDLRAKIADKTYGIGNGVLHKTVPVDGELILLYDDSPGEYDNNSGEFHVNVIIESRYSPLEEIK
ncbi:LecA/PA-IL family lectin [Xenorhabdus bovienii]|uniref:LecA/PA-IL family lectin n=1 Tax=Xenorhabdus bovienii TaxID=40576 RepID=UPI0023B26149|nr:LecA/PA-IL family lectin [Xenorhabdus bovienii]MDE9467278.1 LecA/PA-IL family lectin [Xenorhabdus bovienii]